jgi:tripartite-type tricarboxylate transporter receptor subunit TctC
LGGQVEVVSQTPAGVVPAIKSGQLRRLVFMSNTRWKWVPDIPKVRELGYDFDLVTWLALAAPKGTSKANMDRLIPAFKKALDDREVLTMMDRIYIPVVYRSAEELSKQVETEYKDIEKTILDQGLHKSQRK